MSTEIVIGKAKEKNKSEDADIDDGIILTRSSGKN
jgi:hypothetical protein